MPGQSIAVPVTVLDGVSKVIGISNLDVNGSLYDVAFSDFATPGVSYNAAAAALGESFDFGAAGQNAAFNALISFLNGPPLVPGSDFVNSPGPMSVGVPFDIAASMTGAISLHRLFYNNALLTWQDQEILNNTGGSITTGRSNPFVGSWAIFSQASVPAPATLGLLVIGLALLGFARRRKT